MADSRSRKASRMLWVAAALCLANPAAAQDLPERIDALLTKHHEYGLLNGAVLVADDGEVVYAKGFGDADMSWGIPNTPDTRFRIGSLTKQFTAALVLQLVEEGRVDLDAPVTAYLPDYPAAQGDRITPHHLLTHTSGIPNYTDFADTGFRRDPYAPDSFLATFSGLDLEFEPGTRFSYSNSGYYVLGAIVERVTGQPYADALRDRLLDPLGLADTGYDTYVGVVERMATGYVRFGSGYGRAAYVDPSVPYAAGMMYSTVGDLYRWTLALHRGDPFEDDATLKRMTTPFLSGFAYGVGVIDLPLGTGSVRTVGHDGSLFGFRSFLGYMPGEGRVVVVLDNTEGDASALAMALTFLLYGQPVGEPKRPIRDVVAALVEAEGAEAAAARYRALQEEAPDAYDFAESQLNDLGYAYLYSGDAETAVHLFELNVEAHPDSWNAYDSLGEAYLAAGDEARAVGSYRRALELNPGSASARRALATLGVEAGGEGVAVAEEVLESYVGEYTLQPGFVLAITREGGQLYAQATGQPRTEIYPSSETRFYLTEADAQITFNRDDEGRVEGLTLHQGGRDVPAVRVE